MFFSRQRPGSTSKAKVLVLAVLVAVMASSHVTGARAADILIFGDSTGKGDGAQRRWQDRLLAIIGGGAVENFSKSRQLLSKILTTLDSAAISRDHTIIIYDRRNAGETVDDYIAGLHEAVERVGDARLLILPQVPVSGGREDRLTLEVLLSINERLLAEFSANTFDAETQRAFIGDLSGDDTRSDHIHRNDVGQQIEAQYIASWLTSAAPSDPGVVSLEDECRLTTSGVA